MSWMKQGAKRGPFAGQMSIPCELSLTALGGEYYLAATPISEINGLVKEREVRSDLRLSCDAPLRLHLDKTAYIVKLKAGKASADLALTLFGRTLTLNAKENILTFGCDGIPLSVSEGGVDLIVISDRLSLEIYLDGGRIFASYMDEDSSADYNLSYLELSSSGEFKIDILELSSLRSIWEE